MLSLLCTLPFGVLSGQHIFHQFRQQTFFSAHIFNKLFFLTFVATNYLFQFFSRSPPPDIKWCVPYRLRTLTLREPLGLCTWDTLGLTEP